MTQDDDFIQLHTQHFGCPRIPLKMCGLEWPPPEFIVFDGENMREANDTDPREYLFHRVRYSSLTDDQIQDCDHVRRGAEYRYLAGLDEAAN